MQIQILKAAVILLALIGNIKSFSQTITWEWLRSEGSAHSEYAKGIAIDDEDNVYVVGNYNGSLLSINNTALSYRGDHDIFLLKYNSDGSVAWVRDAGGPAYDNIKSVELDDAGNVYIAGYYNDSIRFGNTVLRPHPKSQFSGAATFLAKYNPLGQMLWAIGSSSPIFHDAPGIELTIDNSNNLYLYGLYSDDMTIGGYTFSTGEGAAYVVKMDTSGTVLWGQSLIGIGFIGGGIATDANGDVYISGSLDNDNLTVGTETIYNVGSTDFFVVKLSGDSGSLQWMKSIAGTGQETCSGVAVSSHGNATIVGWSDSPTLVVGETTYNNPGGYKSYIVQFDSDGEVNWSFMMPSALIYSADVDVNNNVYAAGSGITLLKFSDAGEHLFTQVGGSGNDATYAVSISPQNELYIGGTFYSTSIGFGPFILNNVGVFDMFVGKHGTATGVNEVHTNHIVVAYPNPTADHIDITIADNAKYHFILHDLLGNVIMTETITERKRVDLRNYPSGVYLGHLLGDDSKLNTIRLIKH